MKLQFSENLTRYLKSSGLTLKDLANELEVPISTIHGWMNGIPPRSLIKIKQISLVLNCTMDELCFNDKNIETNTINHQLPSSLSLVLGEDTFQLFLVKINKKD